MYSQANENRTQVETANAVATIRSSATLCDDSSKLKTVNSAEFANLIYTPHVAVAPTTSATTTVNLAQLANATLDGAKCYIAAQPFHAATSTYNYALVNQTTSNYKCDLCSASFSHVTFLNLHKRNTHNIDATVHDNQLSLLANGQHITLQLANSATSQIQIVAATEAIRYSCDECGLSYATQTDLKNHKVVNHQFIFSAESGVKISKACIGCGVAIALNSKKDDGVALKCDSCLRKEYHSSACGTSVSASTIATTANIRHIPTITANTQISRTIVEPKTAVIQETDLPRIYLLTTTSATNDDVGADEAIKFESIEAASASSTPPTIDVQHVIHQQNESDDSSLKAFPVKRRGGGSVTKCHKCNGSGVIYIGRVKNENSPNPNKPYQCNICKGTFSRYSSLWSHKRLHTGEKNFHCTDCGLSFAKAAYLKNHQRTHTGEKPYCCGVCGMKFSQSPHLKNHERIHSGERPYSCEVCEKSFARHSTLWNHRRIHTGEKPYCCEICQSRFNQATHLKNHAKVHSGEKPFRCDICLIGFSDRFALKRHKGVHEKYDKTKAEELANAAALSPSSSSIQSPIALPTASNMTDIINDQNIQSQLSTSQIKNELSQ